MRVGIIGDTHSPVMLEGYAEWCMDVFDQWEVDRIIHIGDLADFHAASFLSARRLIWGLRIPVWYKAL